jgi:hypothetical protein
LETIGDIRGFRAAKVIEARLKTEIHRAGKTDGQIIPDGLARQLGKTSGDF